MRDLVAPNYPYAVDCVGQMRRCSTVILSKTAPLASGGLALGDPENRGGLSAGWVRFDHAGGPFTLIGVHLLRPWPYGDQSGELAQLTRFIAAQDRNRLIVTGDFNLPPWTFGMKRLERDIANPRLSRALPTWPAPGVGLDHHWFLPPVLPLDHVFAGRGWSLAGLARGPVLGSDHLPLVIDLKTEASRAP